LREIQRLEVFRRIFAESSKGRGLASSVVGIFRFSGDRLEVEVARRILLGVPPKRALDALLHAGDPASKELISFVTSQAMVDARAAGRRGERLVVMFERWARISERRRLEQNVLSLRGRMVSAIVGGVLAFLSSLAPFVVSFQLFTSAPSTSGDSMAFAALAMALISSAFLDSYLSIRRRYLGPLIAGTAFLVTRQMAIPITSVTPPILWGVK